MRRTLMLFLCAVLALFAMSGRPGNAAATGTADFCADAEELAFLTLINNYRAANGAGALAFSQALGAAAEHQSQDMATNDFVGHTGTDGSSFSQRFVAHGYTNTGAGGENVFAGDATAAGAFEAWRNSPPHNANMLSPDFKAIGIGRVSNPNSTFGWYWTTTFGATVDAAACLQGGQTAGQPAPTKGAGGTTGGKAAGTPAGNGGGTPTTDGASGGASASTADSNAVACVDAEEQAFLTLINDYRAANGLDPLVLSATLSAAADAHSQDMATNDFLDHTGSNGSTVEERLAQHGYTTFTASGENVFAGDATAAGAFESWRNSPPHNANMLSPDFKAIGIGRVSNPNSTFGWYWTTTFGSDIDAAGCRGPETTDQQSENGATGNGQTDQTGTGGDSSTQTDDGSNTQADDGSSNSDRDGDGILDQDETDFFGTDPDAFDTDGDGVGDGEEVLNGTDPLDPGDF